MVLPVGILALSHHCIVVGEVEDSVAARLHISSSHIGLLSLDRLFFRKLYAFDVFVLQPPAPDNNGSSPISTG